MDQQQIYSDQQVHRDQQLQDSPLQVETDQQTHVEKRRCCNILRIQFDPIASIKNRDFKSAIKESNVKTNYKKSKCMVEKSN